MKVAFLLLAFVAIAAAQVMSPTFPWPDPELLKGIPQVYSAGYILNCGSAGLTGGCSACELGTNGACQWITITEPGLAENQPSCYPYGGSRGVCVPKGIATYRSFVLNYYAQAAIEIGQVSIIPDSCSFGGNGKRAPLSTFDAKSVISIQSARCPADYKKEPAYHGYGLTSADSDKRTQVFRPEYCAFPKKEWPVDRSASSSFLSLFGGNKKRSTTSPVTWEAYTQLTNAEVLCNAVNNAENDLFAEFFAVLMNYGSVNPTDYYSAVFNWTSMVLGDNVFTGLRFYFEDFKYMDRIRECISLDQSALCTSFCPEYGVNYGDFPCTDTLVKVLNTCGFNMGTKRGVSFFGAGIYFTLYGSAMTGGGLGSTWTQILAEWKLKGYEPRCFDPFRIKATDRFQVESGLFAKSPCDVLEFPVGGVCAGECIGTYYNSDHCGGCFNKCAVGSSCEKGSCTPVAP